jgi:hypothetical protein
MAETFKVSWDYHGELALIVAEGENENEAIVSLELGADLLRDSLGRPHELAGRGCTVRRYNSVHSSRQKIQGYMVGKINQRNCAQALNVILNQLLCELTNAQAICSIKYYSRQFSTPQWSASIFWTKAAPRFLLDTACNARIPARSGVMFQPAPRDDLPVRPHTS